MGGLAPKTEECTLSEHFRQYGSVDNAAIKRYPNGVSKQFGFVTFSTLAAARWAVMQEAHFVDGHSMNVDYAEYQPDRRPARVRSVAAHATQKEIEDWLHDARSVKKATAPTSTGRPAWGNSEENGASRSIPRQNAIGSAVAPARSADCSTRSFDKAMDILHAAGIVVRWGAP